MIRKTLKILKKKPIIIILILIPFLWDLGTMLFDMLGILPTSPIDNYATSFTLEAIPYVYGIVIINVVYFIGGAIFAHSPAQHLIYEASPDNIQRVWHKKELQYWWRPMVIALLFGLGISAIAILWEGTFFLICAASDIRAISDIHIIVNVVFYSFTLVFLLIGNSAIFIEHKFIYASRNMFKASNKYFTKVLAIAFITTMPILMKYYFLYAGIRLEIIWRIVLSVWMRISEAFLAVFVMNCYMEYKGKGSLAFKKNPFINVETASE